MAVSTEERRIVTVLFADMAGSTALGEELDPEEMRRLLARYYAIARESVEQHGGTVEKFIGDAVMAVFGLPTAHGDDPDRAVAAALAMRDRIKADRLLDGLARDRVVARQQAPHLLRVELLAECGRARHVGEEDGDDAALLGGDGHGEAFSSPLMGRCRRSRRSGLDQVFRRALISVSPSHSS